MPQTRNVIMHKNTRTMKITFVDGHPKKSHEHSDYIVNLFATMFNNLKRSQKQLSTLA